MPNQYQQNTIMPDNTKTNYTARLSRLYSMGYMPRIGVLLIDLSLCLVAYVIAYVLGDNIFKYDISSLVVPIWEQIIILLCMQVFFFWAFHTYAGILRYSTFVDTVKVLLAIVCTAATLFMGNLIAKYYFSNAIFMNTLLILYFLIAFVLLFCLRVGVKTIFETLQQHTNGNKRVLIYGTKQAGVAIAKLLRTSSYAPYYALGFIEDKDSKKNSYKSSTRKLSHYQILGMKVYYINDSLIDTMRRLNVQSIIISPIKMQEPHAQQTMRFFVEHGIQVLTTPYFTNWQDIENTDNLARIGRINAIQIEDLLERPSIHIDTENVRHTLHEKVIMITGAAGSIGSELVRQAITFQPHTIVLFEQAESALHDLRLDLRNQFPKQQFIAVIGDVRNRNRVEEVISEMRPDIIFHAAAYKHVPLMEDFPNEAIQANVLGTKNVADMAVKYGVKRFVMISTDKAVNPTNIMGASKRIAEIYVQSLFKKLQAENPDCTKFITTRFGNVLGSNGSVIPYFKKQIAAGGPVTVTHPDIIRYFMTIPEACTLVLEASTLGNGGEIFVFDMGQPVKILDLAKNMIRLAGYTPGEDISIVFSGLRPGEKLYEELLNKKETTLPTTNQKIMIAKVREFPFDEVSKQIDELILSSTQPHTYPTVALMKKIVPEYISKNSIFEQLDKAIKG